MSSVAARSGFTLIETALALLVASIGLTAVMALFPAAMGQAKKGMDDTYAAFLADAAFASYRAVAESTNLTWDKVEAYKAIAPVSISVPTMGTDVFWEDSKNLILVADGGIHTQVYTAASTQGKWGSGSWPLADSWKQYDHAVRYRLSWQDLSTRRRALRLEVWPGEFGQTSNSQASVFYTEIFNHGI